MTTSKDLLFGYPRTKGLTMTSLFAAVLAITSIISIQLPFTPVPITLQVFSVLLITAIGGPIYGTLSCLVYLGVGAAGVPVFAGLASGPAVLFGPTGGYLIGFPLASFVGGSICRERGPSRRNDAIRIVLSTIVQLSVIYTAGVLWLASYFHLTAFDGFLAGAVPFLPFDILKAVIAIPVALKIRWWGIPLPIKILGQNVPNS
jgi:biotin transport system substrate-specific component